VSSFDFLVQGESRPERLDDSTTEGTENCNNETAEGAESAEDSGTAEQRNSLFLSFFLPLFLLSLLLLERNELIKLQPHRGMP
jgi:hypothetical protein